MIDEQFAPIPTPCAAPAPPRVRTRHDDDLLRVRHHDAGVRCFDGFLSARDAAAAARRALAEIRNNTLPSDRFMALAMSCVSKVPAAPTTVPAMIMAALSSTKPSNPTARRSTRCTAKSPPACRRRRSAGSWRYQQQCEAKTARRRQAVVMPETTMNPKPTVTSKMARFKNFWRRSAPTW